MNEPTCRCNQPLHNNQTFCNSCKNQLDQALRSIPATAAELEITMTKQRAAATTGGPPAAATGLPFNERAGDTRRDMRLILGNWVRQCQDHNVGPDRTPTDNPASLSRWLLACTQHLQQHQSGPDAVEEITSIITNAQRIIFWKKKNRVYLGPCAYGQSGDGECDGDVYADQGEPVGYCETCGAGLTAVIRQTELDCDIQARLLSAAEIADWAIHMGMNADRETVRKRVLYWHRHQHIRPAAHDQRGATQVPLFRYGDIRPMLASHFDKETSQ